MPVKVSHRARLRLPARRSAAARHNEWGENRPKRHFVASTSSIHTFIYQYAAHHVCRTVGQIRKNVKKPQ